VTYPEQNVTTKRLCPTVTSDVDIYDYIWLVHANAAVLLEPSVNGVKIAI